MGQSRTLVTHNSILANILRNGYYAENVVLIEQLLLDTNSYIPSAIGATTEFVPDLLFCKDVRLLINNLRDHKSKGDVLIVIEPRLDAMCWAQQIASAIGYKTTDKVFVICDSTRDIDLKRALRSPVALPSRYPAEWFYLRMLEGVMTANISANIGDATLPKDFPLQNMYSLYLIFKLFSLAKRVKSREYSIVLRDKITGSIIGEHIPPQNKEGVFIACAAHYSERKNVDRILDESHGEPTLIASHEVDQQLFPGYFPTLSMVFSRILRHTVLPLGAIFNELYKLYGLGCSTYPFATTGNDPVKIRAIAEPILETYNLKVSQRAIDTLHSATVDTISCLPLIGPDLPEGSDRSVQNYIETLTIDAFRSECKSATQIMYYKLGSHYYAVRKYAFKGISSEAANALGYIYPTYINPKRFSPYIRTVTAPDRVAFHTLMGFTMRSPHWIKWFIALHYLLEKELLVIDGESVCLTKRVVEAIQSIDTLYGAIFTADAFPAFDNIFNDVPKYSELCSHLLSLLPTLNPNTQEKTR